MADSNFKPSFGIETLLSGDLAVESEKFLLFMKAYYEWMQTTKIEITSTVGTFVKGETIISASGAKAVIREVASGELIVQVDTRKPFNLLESITGQTSLATANISLVKDNVVRKTGKILDYRNLETSIDQYVDYLRDELYPSIPVTYYGDKRAVASRFKELFISKSNEDSYRFLFKLLYNDNIDFYYPGTDVLRISDGNFEKTQIIRTVATATGTDSLGDPFDRDIFLFLNKTIRGESSGFLANVVDIKKFFIGSREVAEMTLKLVSGTFTAGETIVDIDDDNLTTTIYGIINGVTIIDGGSGYEEGDAITITGDGSEAQARVSSIKESPISALTVNAIGHGYQLNTAATIDNTGTGGSGFIVRVTELANTYSVTSGSNTYTVGEVSQVSVINRGEGYFKKPSITLQDTTIASLGLLSDKLITISNAGSNYGVGNTLVFTGGSGTSAAGQIASVVESTTFDLLFEDGFQMKADGSYYDIIKNEDWSVKGPIKRIELTNFGTGYSSASLPVITVNTTTGSSANLIATNIQGKNASLSVDTSNNITGIGSIRDVEIVNFGINYSAANASASAIGDGNAILSPVISGLGVRQGVWLDDDGKIDYKIIQDSYYYQDYSYVIKSGLTFQTYSDTLKQILHPAGLIYFGEIQITNDINVAAELINNEDISRMLVQLLAQIYVGGEYEYSSINWTIKVEAPVIRLDTDLPVKEYVIHLVPEGDDVTGITDVGVVINQGDARHSFIIQTPFEVDANALFAQSKTTQFVKTPVSYNTSLLDTKEYVVHLVPEGDDVTGITDVAVTLDRNFVIQTPFDIDVTSTSATLPTTKFVIGHLDTLPGYGYNRYGDLPMTPFGVYSEDWSIVPISVLQDVRFSDFYGENPAYQSIMNLFIDNTLDISVSGITSKLKYETFAVSGTIPILQSIVTTESLIVKPEVPIQLNVNDVAISMSTTAMERDLPIYVTLANLNTYGEYVVVISPTPTILDVAVVASAIAPQRSKSAGNIIALYDILLKDVAILDVAGNVFGDNLPQNAYEGTIASFANSTFETSYLNYPLSFQEYVKILPVTSTELNNLSLDTEVVISVTTDGFKYTLYDDLLLSNFASTPISTLSDITFDTNFGTTQNDITIKATTSPYTSGQSPKKSPTDIFRSEIRRDMSLYATLANLETYGEYILNVSKTTSSVVGISAIITTESLIVKPEVPIQLNVNDVAISMSTATELEIKNEFALYDILLKDVEILNVAGSAIGDNLPQNVYEGIIGSFANSTFETSYLNYPLTYQEYVKILPVTSTETNNLFVNREIVVRSEGNGFKYKIYDDALLSDYASTPISTLSDITFDTNLDDTIYDVTIKATSSPYLDGQSPRKNSSDIFRNETELEIESASDVYGLPYGDLPVYALENLAISGTLYDRQLSVETFGTTYPSLYTASNYTKYAKIAGTVFSANAGFGTLPISTFSATTIDVFDDSLLSDLVPIVIGSGTNFVSDFSLGSVLVANNEYFTVDSIANTTYMITDRLPANAFSGVVAYKISSPTYTFSSIPTSINEGANGTFNVATTDIANGTALYWTINNTTTGSGDFV